MKKTNYQFITAGDFQKYEKFGSYILTRPASLAVWPLNKKFENHSAQFIRKASGEGEWDFKQKLPISWQTHFNSLDFIIKPTGLGNVGLFPEQASEWSWFEEIIPRLPQSARILNLFAYTGGSSMVCARLGAEVTHLDAARGVVDWARENARLNRLESARIHWLTEDAQRFVQREIRRKNRYHGIILDPPSFGRGPKGEVWKLEEHIYPLLSMLFQLLEKNNSFLHLSCHTPGFTPQVLKQLMMAFKETAQYQLTVGELVIPYDQGEFPAGSFIRIFNM